MKRGLQCAVDYLKAFQPINLVPPVLHQRAGLDIMVHTLSHSLRRAARTGEVLVSYKPDNSGTRIAYYSYNPAYVAKAPARKTAVYFYTLPNTNEPSGYYANLDNLRTVLQNHPDAIIWTGSHEAPVVVS